MFVFLVAGCATDYQTRGMSGGYHDIYLGNDRYLVSFTGNGYSTKSEARDFVKKRSAEIALERGHETFTVLSLRTRGKRSGGYIGPGIEVTKPVAILRIKLGSSSTGQGTE
ncbi:MAG: hypothetical protein ABEK50_10280, partial [bacterium]